MMDASQVAVGTPLLQFSWPYQSLYSRVIQWVEPDRQNLAADAGTAETARRSAAKAPANWTALRMALVNQGREAQASRAGHRRSWGSQHPTQAVPRGVGGNLPAPRGMVRRAATALCQWGQRCSGCPAASRLAV